MCGVLRGHQPKIQVTHLLHVTCGRLQDGDREARQSVWREIPDPLRGVRVHQQHHCFISPAET